ncbi:MAG: ral secretory system protein domain protein [Cyanobacteria bacterium RYN_339]|nr:ral secretory system protein domain protein [Cyanobacteria bacterium RYN_339]
MYETSRQARESFLEEIGAGFFGEYLISQGLIDRTQLTDGLTAQKSLKAHLKIGELLVKRGALQSVQLMQALTEYKAGIRIGEILIHQGDIGFIQLLEALDHQQAQGCQLGEALVALKHCSQDQIDEVLALQKSLTQEL